MKETSAALNKLARKKMKLKLLQDIRVDIEVCKLEGFCPYAYDEEVERWLTVKMNNANITRMVVVNTKELYI